MAEHIKRQFSFVFFIVLCIVVAGLAGLSWKIDRGSGQLGTTDTGKTGVAWFDLNAGDSIHYDYETNVPSRFIITTDPLNPATGEKLNISGTQNSGWFDCPVTGRYVVQVLFLEMPQAGLATIDHNFYAVDDSSRIIMVAKPITLTVLAVVLASMVSIAGRRARTTQSNGETGTTQSYWEFFASKMGNWIAIVAGAGMLVAASIIDSTNLANWIWGSFIEIGLYGIGINFVVLGLMISMAISWPEYKAKTHQVASRRS